MKHLKQLLGTDRKEITDGILHLLGTDIKKRSFKRHFKFDGSKNILEDSTRYVCKKVGLKEEEVALDLVFSNSITGMKAFLKRFADPRIRANARFYLYLFGGPTLITVSNIVEHPLWKSVLLGLGKALYISSVPIGSIRVLYSGPHYDPNENFTYLPFVDVESATHEICHALQSNLVDGLEKVRFSLFRKYKETRKRPRVDVEGIATCLGIDALYDSGNIKKAEEEDRSYLTNGYVHLCLETKESKIDIERNLKQVGIEEKRIKNLLRYSRLPLVYNKEYEVGYSIVNVLALLNGEEGAYFKVFNTGIPTGIYLSYL